MHRKSNTTVYVLPRDPEKLPSLLLEVYSLQDLKLILDTTHDLLGDFLRTQAGSPREIN